MRRRASGRQILAALALALTAAGCTRTKPVDTVVLVSIDSLRADHVGSYGYPRTTTPVIDALAAAGVRFERAYSTTSWTLPAHAALLSGLLNDTHGAVDGRRKIADRAVMLAEELGRHGIRTTGFYSGPYLDPSFGFGRGFERYVNASSNSWSGLYSSKTAPHEASHADVTNPILKKKVDEWLSSETPAKRNFIFLHMWDVHYDYIAPERYVRMFDADYTGTVDGSNFRRDPAFQQGMSKRDLDHVIALYDAEIRYTDDTLGELLELLRARGLLDNAVVIVTADHGEEFLEHGALGHMWNLYEQVLRVPLVMRRFDAGSSPRTVDSIVSLIDLYPTICQLFDVDCAYEGTGVSLAAFVQGTSRAPEREAALAELTSVFGLDQDALVRKNDKIIRWNNNGRVRYYDFADGIAEWRPLQIDIGRINEYPPNVRSAFHEMDEAIAASVATGKRLREGAKDEAVDLPLATKEHLESLGYIK